MTIKRMIIMLLFALVVFGGVFGMKEFGRQAMTDFLDKMPTPPATIATTKVATMRWPERLNSVGNLVALNGTDVTTEVPGIVNALPFTSGATVEKGDLILELDADRERAELKRLQAQAELAEITRTRREKLFKLESISRADLDEARSQANVAAAAVDQQRALLAQKRITAPFAGTLGIRRVSVGQYLEPGTAIVSLQSLDPIELRFALPEQALARVQTGHPVEITVDGHDARTFRGEITALEARVTAATRNFDVQAIIQNPDKVLRPGQFARVRVMLPEAREVMVLPRTAIQYNSYGSSVYVVAERDVEPPKEDLGPNAPKFSDLHVLRRFVDVGEARGDFVEVLSGVSVGEEVASAGLLKLSNEQPVFINNEQPLDVELEPKAVPEG